MLMFFFSRYAPCRRHVFRRCRYLARRHAAMLRHYFSPLPFHYADYATPPVTLMPLIAR